MYPRIINSSPSYRYALVYFDAGHISLLQLDNILQLMYSTYRHHPHHRRAIKPRRDLHPRAAVLSAILPALEALPCGGKVTCSSV